MKDIIYVENHYFVTATANSIKFKNVVDKSEKYFPIDEVEAIIFDYSKSYFSQKLVIRCIEHNILILFCDLKRSPVTEVISEFKKVSKLKTIQSQFQFAGRSKDRVWKKIVSRKIFNQAKCLGNNTNNHLKVSELMEIAKSVKVGDRENREALAARLYFKMMFGEQFKRGRYDDVINASLNYGYSILRSFIKKELALHGFEMSLGIKHYSLENTFNLADDIIEVYRPFVDNIVYELVVNLQSEVFDIEEKKKLLNVLYEKCIIDKKVVYLLDGIKVTTASLLNCYQNNSPTDIKLPKMIEVGL